MKEFITDCIGAASLFVMLFGGLHIIPLLQ